MRAKRLIVVPVAVAALAASFYAGFEIQRDGGGLGDFVAVAKDRVGPQFAPYYDLEIWARRRTADPEPIIDPTKISEVIGACTGTTTAEIEICATRRRQVVQAFSSALTEAGAARDAALCLTNGCSGLVPIAPANACLFWTLYINSRADQVGAVDRSSRERTCTEAKFGDERRRDGLLRLWNRIAKSG